MSLAVKRALQKSEEVSPKAPKRIRTKNQISEQDDSQVDSVINILTSFASNRYRATDSPPFVVYLVDSRPEENLGNYNKIILGKKLHEKGIELIRIYSNTTDKIVLVFPSAAVANSFVENKELIKSLGGEGHWVGIIPDHVLYKVGVIYEVPLELTKEDILQGIEPDIRPHIHDIIRCKKRNPLYQEQSKDQQEEGKQGQWIDTNAIKIYCKQDLPKEIAIYFSVEKIKAYILPVRQCEKCWRFGHIKTSCTFNSRCVVCSLDHSDSSSCTEVLKCANCTAAHQANNKKCIFFQFNDEISKARSKLNVTYQEAVDIVKERFKKNHKKAWAARILLTERNSDGTCTQHQMINPYFKEPFFQTNIIPVVASSTQNSASPAARILGNAINQCTPPVSKQKIQDRFTNVATTGEETTTKEKLSEVNEDDVVMN